MQRKRLKRFRRPSRRFGRRRVSRKSGRSRISKMNYRGISFPDKMFVKLTTTVNVAASSVTMSDGLAQFNLRGNGFRQGIGEPYPASLPAWASMYGAYRIVGSKIRVDFANPTAPGIIGIFPSNTGEIAIDFQNCLTQAYTRRTTIGGTPNIATLTNYMSTKKMFAQPTSIEDDYQGTFDYVNNTNNLVNCTDPDTINLWFWWIFYRVFDPDADMDSIAFTYTLTYYVLLEDRNRQDTLLETAEE